MTPPPVLTRIESPSEAVSTTSQEDIINGSFDERVRPMLHGKGDGVSANSHTTIIPPQSMIRPSKLFNDFSWSIFSSDKVFCSTLRKYKFSFMYSVKTFM